VFFGDRLPKKKLQLVGMSILLILLSPGPGCHTQEFRTMTQGTMKVEEYEHHFTKMMRYALDDTNIEEKKRF